MQEDEANRVLTPQDVADILKISKNTVYELIKRGELNGYRVGNKVRVDLSDVRAYKKSTQSVRSQPTSEKPPVLSHNNPILSEQPPDENAFVICGQDIILDILSQRLGQHLWPAKHVLRSYLGSYNSLIALYNNEVQVATAHLWDGMTGEYNVSYVKSLLPGKQAVIVNLAYRMQGFYVPRGNPKNFRSWEDLRRPDISIANREKGSGTRILLDERLRLLGINGNSIRGYGRECQTHLAVAGVVARGGADIGLGIEKTAAQVNNIMFIPLQKEQYDLVIKKENLTSSQYEAIISVVQSPEFKTELNAIGGYDTSKTGTVIAEL